MKLIIKIFLTSSLLLIAACSEEETISIESSETIEVGNETYSELPDTDNSSEAELEKMLEDSEAELEKMLEDSEAEFEKMMEEMDSDADMDLDCLLYTSPSPRD